MSELKFLKTESVIPFIEELARDRRVLVPVAEGPAVVYRPYIAGGTVTLDRMPTESPKGATFPRNETILAFRKVRDPENPARAVTEIKERLPEQPTVVFGCRPCGSRGKAVFDRVYETEKITDPYYTRRRKETLFITLACKTPENTCFCTSVGGGPSDTTGSDLLLTPVEGGYTVAVVTEKGEALLESPILTDGAGKKAEAEAVHAAAAESMQADDFTTAPEKLIGLFDNMDFWVDQSSKCISCGTCTYLCPTCYCFNITDEVSGNSGRRLRSWDNCMSYLFTLEASGHNPRTVKAHRLKNRVGHKFSYYPTLHEQIIACCGCGRCIKSCPAAVDIRQIVRNAMAAGIAQAEEAA
ncbi:MAG: hydrogenase [Desulfobacterales bacterium]|nr:MAG: hydrogenase [Desulfobacterales bacterium]